MISIILVAVFFIFSRILDFAVDKLLPLVLMPSYNEMLLASEVNSISTNEMSNVQLLQSLKKWMWQKNDVGWLEIQEITHGKNLDDVTAILMVKQELYRIQQDKKQGIVLNGNLNFEPKLELFSSL